MASQRCWKKVQYKDTNNTMPRSISDQESFYFYFFLNTFSVFFKFSNWEVFFFFENQIYMIYLWFSVVALAWCLHGVGPQVLRWFWMAPSSKPLRQLVSVSLSSSLCLSDYKVAAWYRVRDFSLQEKKIYVHVLACSSWCHILDYI